MYHPSVLGYYDYPILWLQHPKDASSFVQEDIQNLEKRICPYGPVLSTFWLSFPVVMMSEHYDKLTSSIRDETEV